MGKEHLWTSFGNIASCNQHRNPSQTFSGDNLISKILKKWSLVESLWKTRVLKKNSNMDVLLESFQKFSGHLPFRNADGQVLPEIQTTHYLGH